MKSSIKLLWLASFAGVSMTNFANASISDSIETVCNTAISQQVTVEMNKSGANKGNSTLMSQHFNVTACNGKQLLENISLEHAESLSSESQDNQLVNTAN